jgi:hypothetical protein
MFVEFSQLSEFYVTRKHNFSETGFLSVFKWEEG